MKLRDNPNKQISMNTEYQINQMAKATHKVVELALKVEEQKLTIKALVELCDELRRPLMNTRYNDLYLKANEKLNALEEREMI